MALHCGTRLGKSTCKSVTSCVLQQGILIQLLTSLLEKVYKNIGKLVSKVNIKKYIYFFV